MVLIEIKLAQLTAIMKILLQNCCLTLESLIDVSKVLIIFFTLALLKDTFLA